LDGKDGQGEWDDTDVADEFGEDDAVVAGEERASEQEWVERKGDGFVEREAAAAQGQA
jgi:hypothetical protein